MPYTFRQIRTKILQSFANKIPVIAAPFTSEGHLKMKVQSNI
jgi:hypothetical protein